MYLTQITPSNDTTHSTAEEMFLAVGGSVGYWQGNVATLVDDIGALKPSMFIGVPRVFDRIYGRVIGQVCGYAWQRCGFWCSMTAPFSLLYAASQASTCNGILT